MSYINESGAEALTRKIGKINESDLAKVEFTKWSNFFKKHIRETHPDMIRDSNVMFLVPNKLAMKYPNFVDIYKRDGFNIPKTNTNPNKLIGLKGQILDYKGKIYIANKEGKFDTIQKTF